MFADSSVLVAAILSSTGGSFRLCLESHRGQVHLQINRYVLGEVREVLRRKYPEAHARFNAFLTWAGIRVRRNPPVQIVSRYPSVIHPKDAPVLAGAIAAHTVYLITLDRKDFFTPGLVGAGLPIIIVTPKEFFERYWKI